MAQLELDLIATNNSKHANTEFSEGSKIISFETFEQRRTDFERRKTMEAAFALSEHLFPKSARL